MAARQQTRRTFPDIHLIGQDEAAVLPSALLAPPGLRGQLPAIPGSPGCAGHLRTQPVWSAVQQRHVTTSLLGRNARFRATAGLLSCHAALVACAIR